MTDITLLQGNRLFKEGKFELAKAKYEKVCPPWELEFVYHNLMLKKLISGTYPKLNTTAMPVATMRMP